jgi:hypothetical protein
VIFSVKDFRYKYCMHFSSLPCVLNAPPISSSFLHGDPNNRKRKIYGAPHYASSTTGKIFQTKMVAHMNSMLCYVRLFSVFLKKMKFDLVLSFL